MTPAIIVPGDKPWSQSDLEYQAMNVVCSKFFNAGHNCNATEIIVTARSWPQREAFLAAVRKVLTDTPQRWAWYPGSEVGLVPCTLPLWLPWIVHFDVDYPGSAIGLLPWTRCESGTLYTSISITLDQRWVEYPVHFHCDCLGSSFLMLITLDQQWTCYHGPEVSLISCTLLFRLPWIRGGLGALYKLHCDYPGPSISSSIILDQRWVWYPEQFHFNHRGTGNCSISLILNHHNLDFIVTLVDNIRIRSTRADRYLSTGTQPLCQIFVWTTGGSLRVSSALVDTQSDSIIRGPWYPGSSILMLITLD